MKISRLQILFSLIFIVLYPLSSTHATEFLAGTDSPIKRIITPTRDTCYIYKNYVVMFPYLDQSQLQSSLDTWIVIRKRNGDKDIMCSLPQKGIELLTIKAGFYSGLYDHFVFIDIGTGPDGRSIEIHDVEKGRMVYAATYSPFGEPKIENNSLILYKDLDLRYKEHGYCQDAAKWLHESGLDYGFEQKTQFNLDTLQEKPIGKITCSERQ